MASAPFCFELRAESRLCAHVGDLLFEPRRPARDLDLAIPRLLQAHCYTHAFPALLVDVTAQRTRRTRAGIAQLGQGSVLWGRCISPVGRKALHVGAELGAHGPRQEGGGQEDDGGLKEGG